MDAVLGTLIVCTAFLLLVLIGTRYSARENQRQRMHELNKLEIETTNQQALAIEKTRQMELEKKK